MNKKIRKEDALFYHSKGRPGKIEVVPTKETNTQRDLSLAYSPGVAEPCLEIADNVENAYLYTAKGNLVAVISNGTAVLGLGDIGPEAGKPVMEGKGLLFKIYSDIDVFDLELNTKDVDEFVRTVKILEPTFGGVNLEDIKAPECFEIEARLKKELNIPVMHDDQHGTAIISAAAMLNGLTIVGKDIKDIRVVVSGAGASAVSCTKLYISLGVDPKNIAMFDSKGHIHLGRTDLNDMKKQFATSNSYDSLEHAMEGADIFLGLSTANIVSKEMVKSMAKDPIVLAMANPNPEIPYPDAVEARQDVIMATGRSDYPNQVNNVLGFPYIFRGALDVRATEINEEMKLAAVYALAELAQKPVPDIVNLAYNETNIVFGRNYIIPKPVDPRLLTTVAPAVAKAAIASGVARKIITDWDAYEQELSTRLGKNDQLPKVIINKAKLSPKRVVFADAENVQVLKAAQQVRDEGIAFPILLGNTDTIQGIIKEHNLDLNDVSIVDPRAKESDAMIERYASKLYDKRKRKGLTPFEAKRTMYYKSYFGSMMVETGEADAFISGLTRNYPDTIRPALHVIGKQEGVVKVAGMYILLTPKGPLFFSDTTVNLDPTVDELVEITELTARAIERFNIVPRIALVTYANYGSAGGKDAEKMQQATAILKQRNPGMIVEGEMQAHLAFNSELMKQNHPFSDLADGRANTLIFPNLSASNIAYNLLKEAAELETIGPILLGLKRPVHVLQLGSSVREIVNMVAIAVIEAQMQE
ncbi:malate dehydrogenase (oxaloacetate-decarboxylating)(NADP+) [Dyadobacter jejuensis]|uniref:Malate dehydrogenase (Oxaloacetate-decarboxylating)(NADP+) n=1 Tax=Dyadobacter jejuensis TaxID=1082580 RepID=A0A316AGI9_9BACT|nr:NADP-dependent malic enzyme [Dyadobacter jejuensis]PWJ56731.1 malate dehydrogenase (oxaloacetate-decarboxylating)(NADP+) [Dyadobacter jejuensis]